MNRSLAAVVFLLAAGCASTPVAQTPVSASSAQASVCNPAHSILNATLWMQAAAEYQAVALQTYANARRALDEALADPSWIGAHEDSATATPQPPAVILDLDETAIDNSPFEGRVIQAGITYDPKMWKEWTAEGIAPAIPGAREFLAYAASRGVTPFYISNRDQDEMPGTRKNLQDLGFPLSQSQETILLRGGQPGWTSDKASRRAHVAATHRVLLLVGDDLNDFANAREASAETRMKIIRDNTAWWGTRWFMLPNAMYGSWERAAVGRDGTACEQIQRKVEALRTK